MAVPGSGSTIVRQRPVLESQILLATSLEAATRGRTNGEPMVTSGAREEERLAVLLEVSKALSRAVDIPTLLDKIAGFVFQIMDADWAAIMLTDEHGALVPRLSRDRRGREADRAVPQSIARKVVAEKVAVLSDNAPEDQRFGGQSIVLQSVRSAMCAPMIDSEGHAQGVLYVDNLTATHRFGERDLEFLIAFAGIAGVAIENSKFGERLRREALVRSNFERYFAPSLAARIASAPEAVRLGGDKRTVAVLFSDIRGFTALSEGMRPDDIATLLSEYFTVMVDCVFRHGGTLDKFIGDAVLAQWGAPLTTSEDADRALSAALDMMRELERLNETWRQHGRPQLRIGIGLNFGEVFAGNVGSERRMEFTVLGDTVNIAARLCSAARGGEILLTDDLRRALTAPVTLHARPPMDLKGKSQPVPVYSILSG